MGVTSIEEQVLWQQQIEPPPRHDEALPRDADVVVGETAPDHDDFAQHHC